MMLTMLKSKIHRATITEANLDYMGSLTLDPELMEAADMLPFERVTVLNLNNGARFDTYIIVGEPGSRTICLNGAAARLGQPGDLIIALTFVQMSEEKAKLWKPKIVHVDAQNRVVKVDSNPDE